MDAEAQLNYLRETVIPRFQEVGVEGFVLVAYLRLEGGRLQRICIADTRNDAAITDGLRPVIAFAHAWGASPPAACERPLPPDDER